jgi:hypothetical protein
MYVFMYTHTRYTYNKRERGERGGRERERKEDIHVM